MFAYEKVMQFSTHLFAAMLAKVMVPPLNVPAAMCAVLSWFAVLVQLMLENGIVLPAAFTREAGVVTLITPLPDEPGTLTQPPI